MAYTPQHLPDFDAWIDAYLSKWEETAKRGKDCLTSGPVHDTFNHLSTSEVSMAKERKVKTSFVLSRSDLDRVEAFAKDLGLSRSQVIQGFLREGMDREDARRQRAKRHG